MLQTRLCYTTDCTHTRICKTNYILYIFGIVYLSARFVCCIAVTPPHHHHHDTTKTALHCKHAIGFSRARRVATLRTSTLLQFQVQADEWSCACENAYITQTTHIYGECIYATQCLKNAALMHTVLPIWLVQYLRNVPHKQNCQLQVRRRQIVRSAFDVGCYITCDV